MVRKILKIGIFCLILGVFESNGQDTTGYRNINYKRIHNKRFSRQIAPGTKWCGNGDKASNYTDLGYFRETDKCCREHDKCPFNIFGHQTKYGLTNSDMFTRSHCDCDKLFYECLVNASSRMSRTIGEIYFNFLGKKCFRPKLCSSGLNCKDEFEWADGTSWLPTQEELRKMYRLLALIEPELEIDPSEDYVIGSNVTHSNFTVPK